MLLLNSAKLKTLVTFEQCQTAASFPKNQPAFSFCIFSFLLLKLAVLTVIVVRNIKVSYSFITIVIIRSSRICEFACFVKMRRTACLILHTVGDRLTVVSSTCNVGQWRKRVNQPINTHTAYVNTRLCLSCVPVSKRGREEESSAYMKIN